MDSVTLTPAPFLGGYSQNYEGTTLVEVTDLSLMSIAQPLKGRAALQKTVMATWDCALPKPGRSARSKDKKTNILCLGPDTFFALLEGHKSVAAAAKALTPAAYTTDQSDNWVTLRISGPLSGAALERICPIDLHHAAMPTGSFARTSMEHLGTIIIRENKETFLLMSASSSARSFLHAVGTSLKYVS